MKLLLKSALVAGTIATGVLSVGVAEAATFGFSYTFEDGSLLSGEVEGELQDDNDTVFVSSVLEFLFNDIDLTSSIDSVLSYSEVTGFTAPETVMSLSGTSMDFAIFIDEVCNGVGIFDSETPLGEAFGGSLAAYAFPETGLMRETYAEESWTMAALDTGDEASVPEPSLALGLMAIAAGSKALKRKRAA